ncbi:MAG: M3 family metallopeptidase [Pirellulaceae bacterium]
MADMQDIADQAGDKITIEPWDYRFYAEKVRKLKYDLDFNEVKPYCNWRSCEGMMWAASKLYGFQFLRFMTCPCFIPMCV